MTEQFIAQAKMLRLFTLLDILADGSCSIKLLAHRLDTSPRTIYRYIYFLNEIGFQITNVKGSSTVELSESHTPEFIKHFIGRTRTKS